MTSFDAATADITTLLRSMKQRPGKSLGDLFREGADEIDRLRKEIEALRSQDWDALKSSRNRE